MPIKTRIDVEASPEKFKESFALLQKYQTALKAQYGENYLKFSPVQRAATAAGDNLAKFVDNLDKAAGSQTKFAAAAQKAGSSFKGLASGVKQTLENLARYALSPLQLLFPAGLAVGLVGLGAGLAGGLAGASVYGLDREAGEISDRRRRSLGLGVSYGSLTAYDLNFSRFGVGEGTLGAVAGGVYDVTSPAYLGLMSSGATGHGDTSEAAIELIRRIPEIFKNTPDGMIGSVAHSHNLDSLLDLQTIVRLKNHPEEIDAQIKRYREDRKTLDISAGAQQKWASFNAAIERAGQNIETVLGKSLVALAPGLTKFSDDAVKFIDIFIDSGTITEALKGIEGGLQWLESHIGSSEFKQGGRAFLEGLDKLSGLAPAIITLMQIEGAAGAVGLGGLVRSGKLAGVNAATLAIGAGLIGKAVTGHWNDPTRGANRRLAQNLGLEPKGSIRYRRVTTSAPAPHDTRNAKPLAPASPQSMSDIPDLSGESTYSRKGEPLQDVSGFIWHHTGSRGTPEGVIRTLNQRGLGIQYIMDRDGKIYHALPEGTRGAHILPSEINDLSNSNTEGMEVIANDDTDVTMAEVIAAKRFAQDFSKLHPGVQYFGHGEVNPHHKQATEGLTIADAVRNGLAPTTTPSANANVPLTQRTLMNFAGGSAEAAPVDNRTMMQQTEDAFAEMQRNRNRSLKYRGTHILDHMDKSAPPGPIIVHDMTGGSAQVTVSRHEATQ